MGKLKLERTYVFERVNAKLNSYEPAKRKSKLADLSDYFAIFFEIMAKLKCERIYVLDRVNTKLSTYESVKGKTKLPDLSYLSGILFEIMGKLKLKEYMLSTGLAPNSAHMNP